MTFADIAVGTLSAIAPVLISISGVMFVVFGTMFAVKKMKSLVISSAVKSHNELTKEQYWEQKKEEFYKNNLSYEARKEKRENARFSSALEKWNNKVEKTEMREQQKRDYESWKLAHLSMGEYFDRRERERQNEREQERYCDNTGMIVLDEEDYEYIAERNISQYRQESLEYSRVDREEWYVEKRENGAFIVRSESEIIEPYEEPNLNIPDDMEEFGNHDHIEKYVPDYSTQEGMSREDWYLHQEKSMSEDMGLDLSDDYHSRRAQLDEQYRIWNEEQDRNGGL